MWIKLDKEIYRYENMTPVKTASLNRFRNEYDEIRDFSFNTMRRTFLEILHHESESKHLHENFK